MQCWNTVYRALEELMVDNRVHFLQEGIAYDDCSFNSHDRLDNSGQHAASKVSRVRLDRALNR